MKKQPSQGLILLTIGMGLFMVVIDVSILNIALPSIAHDLKASFNEIQWAVISYSLALTGLVPVFGRISDIFGRKKLFILGQILFVLSSTFAAFSHGMIWLIFARVFQAFGGAMIASNTLALIADIFPEGKRGVAMGLQSILISGGAALGPTLGGFLITHFGWASIFLINIPVGLISALLSLKVLPGTPKNHKKETIDYLGALVFIVSIAFILLPITKAPEWGWMNNKTLIFLGVGISLHIFFIKHEFKIPHPLIDFSLFKNVAFSTGQICGVFAMITLSSMSFLFPFYWQNLRGFDAQTAGFLMLPMPIAFMFFSPLGGKLSDRYPIKIIGTIGLSIIAIALFLLSSIEINTPIWSVVLRVLVLGTGLGFFMAPNNNSVMSSVPHNRRGIAAGLLGMSRYTGQSLGVALGGVVFIHFLQLNVVFFHEDGGSISNAFDIKGAEFVSHYGQGFIQGFHAVCLLTIPLILAAALLTYKSHLIARHQ